MYIFRIYTFYNFYLSVIKLIDGLNYALANVKVKLLQVKRNRGSICIHMIRIRKSIKKIDYHGGKRIHLLNNCRRLIHSFGCNFSFLHCYGEGNKVAN